jgi:hypothetical protein
VEVERESTQSSLVARKAEDALPLLTHSTHLVYTTVSHYSLVGQRRVPHRSPFFPIQTTSYAPQDEAVRNLGDVLFLVLFAFFAYITSFMLYLG